MKLALLLLAASVWAQVPLPGGGVTGGAGPVGTNNNFVFDGDSITSGLNGAAPPNDYPTMASLLPAISGRGTKYNVAVSGKTCTQLVADYPAKVRPLSPSVTGRPGYYFIMCGTNNVVGSVIATEYNVLKSLWALAKADGFKVAAMTIPRESPFGSNSSTINLQFNQYNDLIRGGGNPNTLLYDYLIDAWNLFPDPYNLTYYQSDFLHLTALANVVLSRRINDALLYLGGTAEASDPSEFMPVGTGVSNVRVNMNAMPALTTGSGNIALGDQAGLLTTTATASVMIGLNAGSGSNTDNTIMIGQLAGQNSTATNSVYLGRQAGQNSTGSANMGIGAFALFGTTGANNTAIGNGACSSVTTGIFNLCLGFSSDASAGAQGVVQLGSGTNSTNNTLQFQSVKLADNAGSLYTRVNTPASAAAACTANAIWQDASFVYVCVASGNIKRVAISTW